MYQALYRKYRPKTFSDVYGQDHVISTLKNEIRENRISHAYLFTGSRGTGKTSCAKIFAKAVNCENSADGEPCNECEVCLGLDRGTIYDVIEIDAASNNGVDNIRDLREEANYTPSRGRYRVYIIDEVHMLSIGAFNALLKILEEPPAHVIFILATTEVHKIPATILSRCQRFDFKRIMPETMAARLKEVADFEGVTLTDDAAVLIARIADGALRDGLSILDQCSVKSENIDCDVVSQIAGIAGREALYRLTECIGKKDSASSIELVAELYANSYDMQRLCVELINHFRNFLIVKTVKNSRGLIVCTDDEYNSIVECAGEFTFEAVLYALDLLENAITKIKAGANARMEVEMALVKLCSPKLSTSNDALLDRISSIERKLKTLRVTNVSADNSPAVQAETTDAPTVSKNDATRQTVPSKDESVAPLSEKNNAEQGDYRNEQTVSQPSVQASQEKAQPASPDVDGGMTQGRREFTEWNEFLDIIHKTDIALFGVLSTAGAHFDSGRFVIDSTNPTIKEFIKIPTHLKAIKQAVYELTGVNYKLAVSKQTAKSEPKRDLLEDLINQAQNNIDINFE